MTTKTVAVQLVAMTSQYQASMGAATASTAKLQTASASAGSAIGKVMGPQIALAGAAVAGVAVKMAYDWDNAFTRIASITNSSQAQVEQWKEQVKGLAGETAIAPQELAEALYFLASAGLDASEVMPTLALSAKAAAVGLGETGDIARLTANVLNAYAASGITAAEVTDTLVAAVRSGTAEPDEFADAMGRIIPVSSKVGVSFDQVAASLASLSNIGLDVDEGVTAMRGTMMALLGPGQQAQDMLAELGLSADEVRRSLAEDGLLATLRMLEDATGGNVDMLRKIVPNVRALAGVFGLTGQEAAKVDALFKDLMESSGSLETALDKTRKSAGYQLRKAFVDLQNVGIELGETLLPVFADLAGAVSDIIGPLLDAMAAAKKFIAENEPAEAAVKGWGTSIKESLVPGLALATSFFDDTGDAAKEFGGAVGHAGKNFRAAVDDVGGAAGGAEPPIKDLGGAVKETVTELEKAEKVADNFALALMTLAGIALDVEDATLGWNQSLIDMRKELRAGEKTLDVTSQAGIDNREAFKSAAEAALEHGEAVRLGGGSVQKAVGVVKDHIAQLRQEAIQAGFTAEEIDAYIRKLNLTPKQITTLIKAKTAEAQNAIDAFIRTASNRVIEIAVRTRIQEGTGHGVAHGGGVVGSLPRYHGGGKLKSDEEMILARKGETIRTVGQERALRNATPVTVRVPASNGNDRSLSVAVRLDRRRFTNEIDHDATYAGRWSG